MPFDAAEALLWGKKTHDEHKFLFPRMRELEEQHRAYDTRIQATETIAEAAEAATSRLRRIEQQIAAIESDEQDRPFDRWVQEEITAFKGFVEKNKSVRQKQVEIEAKMAGFEEFVDKSRDASTSKDIEILLERISRLENERMGDTNRIKKLEREVIELTLTRRTRVLEGDALLAAQTQRPTPQKPSLSPPRRSTIDTSDAEAETEDEDIQPPRRNEQLDHEQVRVPCSPPQMPK
jgi:DNA repair exonuclease SbcCD ATPase subunit